ncbi:MAG TPA: hypothetical protein VHQ46_01540 [Desulfobacteria bacterium]|nr:hypothetical protein [Desulfobacteria bacterium]
MAARKGNLVQNASFELGLLAWQSENVISVKGSSHTGAYRAVLGGTNQLQATLSQDIRIFRKRHYLLSFFAVGDGIASDLHLKLVWLDKRGSELGIGLNFDIPGKSITPLPLWSFFVELTGRSPEEARYARLIFTKDLGGFISLDDLLFYEQGGDRR